MQTLYINLTRSVQRKIDTENELKRIGINDYTRIEAIDGSNKYMNRVVACFSSHIKALTYICQNKITTPVLILEDDPKFTDNFCHNQYHWSNEIDTTQHVLFWAWRTSEPAQGNTVSAHWRYVNNASCVSALCYQVPNHIVAEKMITQLKKCKYSPHIDECLFFLALSGTLPAYWCTYPQCTQNGAESTIKH